MQVPKEYCYLKGKVYYGIDVVPLVIKPSNRLLIVNTKEKKYEADVLDYVFSLISSSHG